MSQVNSRMGMSLFWPCRHFFDSGTGPREALGLGKLEDLLKSSMSEGDAIEVETSDCFVLDLGGAKGVGDGVEVEGECPPGPEAVAASSL